MQLTGLFLITVKITIAFMEKLKYRIQEIEDQLPKLIKTSDIIGSLKDNGVSYNTYNRDKKISVKDAMSIPHDRLQIYAGLFNCDVNDLINNIIKTKPIVNAKNLTKKLGIKVPNS